MKKTGLSVLAFLAVVLFVAQSAPINVNSQTAKFDTSVSSPVGTFGFVDAGTISVGGPTGSTISSDGANNLVIPSLIAANVAYANVIQNVGQSFAAGTPLVVTNVTNVNGSLPMVFKAGGTLTAGNIACYGDAASSTKACFSYTGALNSVSNITSSGGFVAADTIQDFNGVGPLLLKGQMADSASAVGVALKSGSTLATAGAKVVSVRNNATEVAYVDKDGQVVSNVAAAAPAFTTAGGKFCLNAACTAYLYATGANNVRLAGAAGFGSDSNVFELNGSGLSIGTLRGPNGAIQIKGTGVDGASAIGATIGSESTFANATAKLVCFRNNATDKTCFDLNGKAIFDTTDSTGTPGAATVNKPSGKSAVAAAASSVVITNSTVTAASFILLSPISLDTTCTRLVVTAGAGSFTVTCNAATTAATSFGWLVVN